ncbi:MAG: hypothetical protein Q9187_007093, partial [Circinaria calcarea]
GKAIGPHKRSSGYSGKSVYQLQSDHIGRSGKAGLINGSGGNSTQVTTSTSAHGSKGEVYEVEATAPHAQNIRVQRGFYVGGQSPPAER